MLNNPLQLIGMLQNSNNPMEIVKHNLLKHKKGVIMK